MLEIPNTYSSYFTSGAKKRMESESSMRRSLVPSSTVGCKLTQLDLDRQLMFSS